MLSRSPSGRSAPGRAASCLSTGCDSPVSADSSTFSARQLDQPQVGRHDVAGLEQHHVAGHQLRRIDGVGPAAADHARLRAAIFFSAAIARSARYSWTKPMMRVEHDDDDDGDGVLRLADDAGDHGRGDQHDDHEVGELRRQHQQRVAPAGLEQRIRADLRQPRPGRVGAQPGAEVAVEVFCGRLAVEAVPLRRAGIVGQGIAWMCSGDAAHRSLARFDDVRPALACTDHRALMLLTSTSIASRNAQYALARFNTSRCSRFATE